MTLRKKNKKKQPRSEPACETAPPISEHNPSEKHELGFLSALHFAHPPPPEICAWIFKFLRIEDLLLIPQINHSWKTFTECSYDYNFIWWKLCMNSWYDDPRMRPKSMSKKDKGKLWKDSFLKLTIKEPDVITKKKDPRNKRQPKEWEIEVGLARPSMTQMASDEEDNFEDQPVNHDTAPRVEFKQEMRTYYKSVRSKPKGKESHSGGRLSEWDVLSYE
eukprot:TRINITY_DN7866_c0_g1_i1.p1 TRINITY_DN7866_c0_g1~~TRINITY_DN7866_c0_g1_i1.p1  ORF type:complete len:219 (-),score=43.46 TRINITY_DN7866_c0_g1_i1:20-676(-)